MESKKPEKGIKRIDPKLIKKHKNMIMNQLLLNFNKSSGLTPLELRAKMKELSKKLDELNE